MSTLHEIDMSEYLPIYFNSDNLSGGVVPSTILCYDTGTPDYWCFHPVDNVPENEEVVTIYNEEWKVRELIVLVNEENTSLQEKLGTLGSTSFKPNREISKLRKAPL